MINESKKNQVFDLLQRYEITKLYTSIKDPIWDGERPIYGLCVSSRFHMLLPFIRFLDDLNSISSNFKIKPIAPDLYHGTHAEIEQMASEENYFCCYTKDKGWLY